MSSDFEIDACEKYNIPTIVYTFEKLAVSYRFSVRKDVFRTIWNGIRCFCAIAIRKMFKNASKGQKSQTVSIKITSNRLGKP